MKTKTQKGFTLVELAIVMTIIGLLIGGILKGQELMQTARVTSTVAQIKSFEAAITSFADSYSGLPGDLPDAHQRLQGCNNGCDNDGTGIGNGILGSATWATAYAVQGGSLTAGNAAAGDEGAETWQFWTHLLMANLISGVTDQSIRAATPYAWNITHPSAKLAGGYIVGNTRGALLPGAPTAATANTGPTGLTMFLVETPTSTISTSTTAGSQPLSPSRAAQIDRKMDDGRPAGGYVQSYGQTGASGCNIDLTMAYNEAVTTEACGLAFRIQG